jgi:hypothetical protein
VLKLVLVVSQYCGSGIPHDKGYLSSEQSFSSQYERPIQRKKNRPIAFSLAMVAIAFANAPRLAGRLHFRKNTCDRTSLPSGLLGQRLTQFFRTNDRNNHLSSQARLFLFIPTRLPIRNKSLLSTGFRKSCQLSSFYK